MEPALAPCRSVLSATSSTFKPLLKISSLPAVAPRHRAANSRARLACEWLLSVNVSVCVCVRVCVCVSYYDINNLLFICDQRFVSTHYKEKIHQHKRFCILTVKGSHVHYTQKFKYYTQNKILLTQSLAKDWQPRTWTDTLSVTEKRLKIPPTKIKKGAKVPL